VDRANDTPGALAAQIAAAALRTWKETHLRLSPVIGDQGFVLLYKRSVHLTSSSFPWLANEPGKDAVPVPPFNAPLEVHLRELAERLERVTPEQAAQASRAIFSTFTQLLNVLIGVGLTTHLLASVAPEDISGDTP
jgi:hypothetical protein